MDGLRVGTWLVTCYWLLGSADSTGSGQAMLTAGVAGGEGTEGDGRGRFFPGCALGRWLDCRLPISNFLLGGAGAGGDRFVTHFSMIAWASCVGWSRQTLGSLLYVI